MTERPSQGGLYKPFFIFDFDGTLCLNHHRDPLVPSKNNRDPEAWNRYFRACVSDEPNLPVITIFRSLVHQYGMDGRVQIWTGRSDSVRQESVTWLNGNIPGFSEKAFNRILRMRPVGDFRPDDKLKLVWLNELNADGQARLIAVFDDRDKVVAMWRANGVACMQVAPGSF